MDYEKMNQLDFNMEKELNEMETAYNKYIESLHWKRISSVIIKAMGDKDEIKS